MGWGSLISVSEPPTPQQRWTEETVKWEEERGLLYSSTEPGLMALSFYEDQGECVSGFEWHISFSILTLISLLCCAICMEVVALHIYRYSYDKAVHSQSHFSESV